MTKEALLLLPPLAGLLFAPVALFGLRKRRREASVRAGCWLNLLWAVGSTGAIGVWFLAVDKQAAASNTRNIGIPIFFFLMWFFTSLLAPLIAQVAISVRSQWRQ